MIHWKDLIFFNTLVLSREGTPTQDCTVTLRKQINESLMGGNCPVTCRWRQFFQAVILIVDVFFLTGAHGFPVLTPLSRRKRTEQLCQGTSGAQICIPFLWFRCQTLEETWVGYNQIRATGTKSV